MVDAKNLSKKPKNELKMESLTEEIRIFIKRIRSMAIEVILMYEKFSKKLIPSKFVLNNYTLNTFLFA